MNEFEAVQLCDSVDVEEWSVEYEHIDPDELAALVHRAPLPSPPAPSIARSSSSRLAASDNAIQRMRRTETVELSRASLVKVVDSLKRASVAAGHSASMAVAAAEAFTHEKAVFIAAYERLELALMHPCV